MSFANCLHHTSPSWFENGSNAMMCPLRTAHPAAIVAVLIERLAQDFTKYSVNPQIPFPFLALEEKLSVALLILSSQWTYVVMVSNAGSILNNTH